MFANYVKRRGWSDLWTHRDFVNFWAAESLSLLGSQVSMLALPMIAALSLDASAFEVGALAAAGQAPIFIFGLLAGAWVERRKRRPILITADLLRAGLLLIIPLAAVLDRLSMGLLYAVALLAGSCTVFFDVSYLSYVPSLVGRDRLVEANSKLEATASTAQVAGPFLGGVLVGLLTAPYAMFVDALSFLGSALFLRRIERTEPEPEPAEPGEGLFSQIRSGLRYVWHEPTLRSLAACAAVTNFAGYIFLSIYVLFMLRDLDLGSTAIGLVFGAGGVGALIGSLFAERLAARYGTGWVIIGSQLGFGVTGLLVPVAVLIPSVALPLVVAAEFLQWLTILIFYINAVSLRQTITADAYLGRVNATFTFVSRGAIPLGSLVGGLLGGVIGLPMTLVVGEIGMFLAVFVLLASPLRERQDRPVIAQAEIAPSAVP